MKKTVKTIAGLLCAVMLAWPVSAMTYSTWKMGEFMIEEAERLKDVPQEKHCSIAYYKDAEHTEEYGDVTMLPTDEYVYYEITCDDGYYIKWISIIGEYMDDEKIRFGDHAPADPEVNCVLIGDINSDGKVGIGDVATLMRHMAIEYYSFSDEMIAADFNGDGKFNLSDCSMLLKYIAKWDVTMLGESAEAPGIYCEYDSGKVDSTSPLEKWEWFYNVSVISTAKGLEDYIAEYSDEYLMDSTEEQGYSAELLREAYGEEFFEENELVLFDFSDSIANGTVYVETVDDSLRLAVRILRKTGVPTDGKTAFHKAVAVSKGSGIDLSDGIEVVLRDGNTVGARYLLRCVDQEVNETVLKTAYYN